MTDALSAWFRARTVRERTLLTAAGLLVLAISAWLAVLAPMGEAKAQAKLRYDVATSALGLARAEAAARRQTRASPQRAALTGQVGALLGRAAEEAGFVDARVAMSGPTAATVLIEAARAQAAFAWLHQMEARGLRIVSLRTAANADRTLRLEAAFEAPRR